MSDPVNPNSVPLAVGAGAYSQFNKTYPYNWFKTALTAGQTYRFSISDIVALDGYKFDLGQVFLNLLDGQGNILDKEMITSSSAGPVMEFTPTSSGTFYLVSENDGGPSTGMGYKLNAAVAAPDDFADGIGTSGMLAPGGSTHGNFEAAGDRDTFKFHATMWESYTFSSAGIAGEVPILSFRIYDASGKLVPPLGSFKGLYANTSGDYYVTVEGGGIGAYTLVSTVTPDDYPQNNTTTGVIAPGGQLIGKIDYSGDVDRFRISMQAGTSYTLELSSGTAAPVSLQVHDSAGNTVLATLSHAGSGASDYTLTAPTTGDYYADVSSDGSSLTTYTLKALGVSPDDYGDTISAATRIAVGATLQGAIQTPSDIDMFGVDLVAGTTYAFALQPQASTDSLNLVLRDADGSAIYNYGVTQSSAAKFFTFTPVVSASYYLAASGSGPAAPTYALSVTKTVDDVGASTASAGHLAIGGEVRGVLEQGGGDLDWYAVALDAGTTYLFTLSGRDKGTGTLPQDGGRLQVVDAQGNALSLAQLGGYENTAPELSFAATASGTYYLQVSGNGRATGTYELQAQVGIKDDVGNDAQHATHIDIGKTQTGVMEIARDVDVFAIDVVAGTTYSLTRTIAGEPVGPVSVELSVTDDHHNYVSFIDLGNDGEISEFFTATSTGTYYVTLAGAGSNGSPSTPYTLTPMVYSSDDVPANTSTTAQVAINGSLHGKFDFPSDEDYVRVHLEAGSSYAFRLLDDSASPGTLDRTTAWLALLDSNGHDVLAYSSQDYTDIEMSYTAVTTGDYYINVHENALNPPGIAYTLDATLTSGDVAPPVVTSATPSSNLGVAADITLTFNEPIRLMLQDLRAITLVDMSGGIARLPEQRTISIDGNTLNVHPDGYLKPGATYTLDFSGVTDSAGNVSSLSSLSFTTVPAVKQGGDGDDYLVSAANGKTLDGGAGLDTVYSDSGIAGFQVDHDAKGNWILRPTIGTGADTLINVERVVGLYRAVALDIDGHAGQAYRLYQAAFDRAPDQGGLGYWMNALDKGTSLHDVADSFVHSAEFATLYGAATSDAQFLTLLYNNVLHRAPDADGAAYWSNAFQHGLSRPDALTSFSESGENQAAVIGKIADGIAYNLYRA